jgi:hypothetical protein
MHNRQRIMQLTQLILSCIIRGSTPPPKPTVNLFTNTVAVTQGRSRRSIEYLLELFRSKGRGFDSAGVVADGCAFESARFAVTRISALAGLFLQDRGAVLEDAGCV